MGGFRIVAILTVLPLALLACSKSQSASPELQISCPDSLGQFQGTATEASWKATKAAQIPSN